MGFGLVRLANQVQVLHAAHVVLELLHGVIAVDGVVLELPAWPARSRLSLEVCRVELGPFIESLSAGGDLGGVGTLASARLGTLGLLAGLSNF